MNHKRRINSGSPRSRAYTGRREDNRPDILLTSTQEAVNQPIRKVWTDRLQRWGAWCGMMPEWAGRQAATLRLSFPVASPTIGSWLRET